LSILPNVHADPDNHLSIHREKARTMSHYQHERTYRYERYHVSLGDKRTTASIDKTLSNLLSLHLGQQPDTVPAQLAVRNWLQARLDYNKDPDQTRVSQWLQSQVAQALISPALLEKYEHWISSQWIKDYPSA